MNIPKTGLASIAGLLLLSTAGCGDDREVPLTQQSPPNTPGQEQEPFPAAVPGQPTPAQAADLTEGSRVIESDVIPEEYLRNGFDSTPVALAEVEPTEGYDTSGLVSFIPTKSGVRVIARFINIPAGRHGFHVHENGDCSATDASSAGGHFNPTGASHAGRAAENRHVGDLGNLIASTDDLAATDFYDGLLALEGPNSVIGKAIIVHSGEDDLRTQPSGDAGDRIACGVIERFDGEGSTDNIESSSNQG